MDDGDLFLQKIFKLNKLSSVNYFLFLFFYKMYAVVNYNFLKVKKNFKNLFNIGPKFPLNLSTLLK